MSSYDISPPQYLGEDEYLGTGGLITAAIVGIVSGAVKLGSAIYELASGKRIQREAAAAARRETELTEDIAEAQQRTEAARTMTPQEKQAYMKLLTTGGAIAAAVAVGFALTGRKKRRRK